MSKAYVGYSKEEFERKLEGIRLLVGIESFREVTDLVKKNDHDVWEYVYSSSIEGVEVRIYSTIDIETKRTRDVGSDKLKILLVRKTENGYEYCKVGTHLRIKTLFDNIKKTLEGLERVLDKEYTSDKLKVMR